MTLITMGDYTVFGLRKKVEEKSERKDIEGKKKEKKKRNICLVV